jgi:hypothetical protein
MSSSFSRRLAATASALVALPLAAVLSAALSAAPAHAEAAGFRDPADAVGSPTDVRRVRINHTDRALRLRVGFTDLRRTGASGLSVFVDTDRGRRGPERVLSAGLFDGTDYLMFRSRGWQVRGEPLSCSYRVGLDYADDVARVRIARGCLTRADQVRVALRMTDDNGDDGTITDWLGERRELTRWLAAG